MTSWTGPLPLMPSTASSSPSSGPSGGAGHIDTARRSLQPPGATEELQKASIIHLSLCRCVRLLTRLSSCDSSSVFLQHLSNMRPPVPTATFPVSNHSLPPTPTHTCSPDSVAPRYTFASHFFCCLFLSLPGCNSDELKCLLTSKQQIHFDCFMCFKSVPHCQLNMLPYSHMKLRAGTVPSCTSSHMTMMLLV